MEDFLKTMAEKWPSHEQTVKDRLSRIVDENQVGTATAEFYLGAATGLLIVTEKLKGVFSSMDDDVKSAYFSIISYCGHRYWQLQSSKHEGNENT